MKRYRWLSFLFVITLGACDKDSVSADNKPPEKPEGWQLVWSDEFSVNGLPDPLKWGYQTGGSGWGNDEKQ
ncbi:MAG TPA: glycoside hydrolase family 16 protein, partial [bacterium]|nr:glycoside hydrolase family 16 protein [bacterium]